METNKTEEEIVKKFIIKNKQERILWELGSPKKREKIFWRFPDTEIFKKNCLQPVTDTLPLALEEHLHQLVGNKSVYFIGENYIGELSLKQAVDRANRGAICIIYCGNGIGYYQGEQGCNGKPPRYWLLCRD